MFSSPETQFKILNRQISIQPREGYIMLRANHHFIPHQVWHLTQRCHNRQWVLKFRECKCASMRWLFESRRRYGLSVWDYVFTSNSITLMVFDQGEGEVARSMQLIARQTEQA